jgi:hypothetical protein
MYLSLSKNHLPKIKRFHYSVVSIMLFLILLSVNQLANASLETIPTPEDQKDMHPWLFYDKWSNDYDQTAWQESVWKPSAKSVKLTRLNGADVEVVGPNKRITWGSTYRATATTTALGVDLSYEWWTFDKRYKNIYDHAGSGWVVNFFSNKTGRKDDQYVDYSDFTVTDEQKQDCLGVIAFNIDNNHVLGSFTNCNIGEPRNEVITPPNEDGVVEYEYRGRIKKGKVIRAVVSDGNGLNTDNISYQWQWTNNKTNGWRDFGGQTNATFKLRGRYAGKKHVQVKVTYTDNDGYTETRYGPEINKKDYD